MSELVTEPRPVEKTIGKTVVRLQCGDITRLAVDAIVYYAREDLSLGPGYGRAIESRGGPSILAELQGLRVGIGLAVCTTAGNLPAKYIIHACGPKFNEPGTPEKLWRCMYAAMFLADSRGMKSIAFPPMGAGFYGVPLATCVAAMLVAIKTELRGGTRLKEIVICVTDHREFEAFRVALEAL